MAIAKENGDHRNAAALIHQAIVRRQRWEDDPDGDSPHATHTLHLTEEDLDVTLKRFQDNNAVEEVIQLMTCFP